MGTLVTQPEPAGENAPYLRIVGDIRSRITTGELRPGDRVPSTRQIIQRYGVAMATASKVLATLRHEGLVRARPGVGTVVDSGALEPVPPKPTRSPTARRRPDGPADNGGRGLVASEGLTRKRIVVAAIALVDAEGLPALSMRRLATELSVATMSLYRYVPGKDELIEQMLVSCFNNIELPARPPGWRAQLEVLARLEWDIYRQHPWVPQLMSISFSRPQLIPPLMRHTEWVLRAIDGFGLDENTMLLAAVTLAGYVQGTALKLTSEIDASAPPGGWRRQAVRADRGGHSLERMYDRIGGWLPQNFHLARRAVIPLLPTIPVLLPLETMGAWSPKKPENSAATRSSARSTGSPTATPADSGKG